MSCVGVQCLGPWGTIVWIHGQGLSNFLGLLMTTSSLPNILGACLLGLKTVLTLAP